MPGLAQQSSVRGDYTARSRLISVTVESADEIIVVTTDTVPGKQCKALDGPQAQFPVMVLPTTGAIGKRELWDGTIRGLKTLREAVARAGADAVLGLRTNTFSTCKEEPQMLTYSALAQGEDAEPCRARPLDG